MRKQAGEVILASDPAFDAFMAMRWVDFQSFAETFVFSCKEWDESAPITLAQIKAFLENLKGIKP